MRLIVAILAACTLLALCACEQDPITPALRIGPPLSSGLLSGVSPSGESGHLGAGPFHNCVVRPDGTVACWGRNSYGQATSPSGTFTEVNAGFNFNCGLKPDGTLACWGQNDQGQATPPAGTFRQVSAGGVHACAVKIDGTLACWGLDNLGQATPPDGTFTEVTTGDAHTCALRTDGTLACWGLNNLGQATPPAGTFTQVSAAGLGYHTCALKTDGTVACWGSNTYGQATPPSGTFKRVSAASFHTCALKPDGAVVCWGRNDYGQATPPSGTFTQVGGGVYHTCAVRPDGTVACWGLDSEGQATPPAGNEPPIADANGPYSADEGAEVLMDGTGSSDPDGDPLTYAWDFGDGAAGTGATATHTYADDGTYTITLTVTDEGGASNSTSTTATVSNVAPTCGAIVGLPTEPVQVGTPVSGSVSFSDPGILDTHTAQWNWNDGSTSSGTVDETDGSGSANSDSHDYDTAGIRTVQLTLTDSDGGRCTATFEYVVVYDPAGGFVTGGGWIDSPTGAYTAFPLLTGKANFGFVAKYNNGTNTPEGTTEFRFQAGDLNFHSSTYEWLVVTGSDYARFKGEGTVNGTPCLGGGAQKFMIWARDGYPDEFRIRIWCEDETTGDEHVIYDNGSDQEIGGGSIVIHKKN